MKPAGCVLLTCFAAIVGPVPVALAATEATVTNPSAEEMDQIVVQGTQLWELRAAVIKAEDRLLARYNELNKDDDLDIDCRQHKPTGTHIEFRYCLTRLQERAQQRDGSEFLAYLQGLEVTNGQNPPDRPETLLLERQADYRKNLVRLLRNNPDLRQLINQRADALRRYEARRAR